MDGLPIQDAGNMSISVLNIVILMGYVFSTIMVIKTQVNKLSEEFKRIVEAQKTIIEEMDNFKVILNNFINSIEKEISEIKDRVSKLEKIVISKGNNGL